MEFESPHPDKHMQQEKGQIEILLLILGIIGVLIFTGFFKSKGNSEVKPAVPSYQKENVAPSHGLKPSEPSLVPVSDGIAPYRFNPAPIEGLPSNTRQTVISLGTNEKAICKYSSISGVSYDAMQYTLSNSADGTLHYASITALNEGTAYNYYVKCLDQSGNKNKIKKSGRPRDLDSLSLKIRSAWHKNSWQLKSAKSYRLPKIQEGQ